jgi:hypothetical protein
MKKFSKILESINDRRFYKIEANIELIVEADNEGEAGYLGDSILNGIEEQFTYNIINIEETENRITESKTNFMDTANSIKSNGKTTEEQIELLWEAEFGNILSSVEEPTKTDKMEWYHQMRKMGYDGIMIFNTLKDKF